jgi:uncharacterized protein
MKMPDLVCKIDAYCSIFPSEDAKKVQQAILNIFPDMKIKLNEDSLKATSSNLESLSRLYETIQARKTHRVYRRQLNHNLTDNSTWLYLNKQAAFVNIVALCSESEESPLGPIKVILTSKDIERIIEWLISDSKD